MTPHKQRLFQLFTLLLPAAFLVLLELMLRLFNLFPQDPLVIESAGTAGQYFELNRWVAKRYFDGRRVTVPGIASDKFAKHKAPKTFRIFCLGGSTTAGFPFDCNVTFPVQLRHLLQRRFPDYEFEVINAGISAVNSFTVLDLLPEILVHSPDLLLLYMGHNEFYGAYGSASTISGGSSDTLVRFYLKLKKLHLVQMLKRALALLAPIRQGNADRSLMASVVGDHAIALESTTYRQTLRSFAKNLELILEQCREQDVPVILSNLVSNVRDLPPFASGKLAIRNESARTSYEQALTQGLNAFHRGKYAESLTAFMAAMQLDSSRAELWYQFGRVYDQLGDSSRALHYYLGAKDRDIIRFRASEDASQILGRAAAGHRTGFVDMQSAFRSISPHGIVGSNIMVDHLHPNPEGYYLMARSFFTAIRESGMLANPDTSFIPATTPYHVTELDWEIGLLKIFEMVHRWPFEEKQVSLADYRPYGDLRTKEIAQRYLIKENIWSRAHYRMAGLYLEAQDYARAREEFLAVSLYAPQDPYPYQQVAKTFLMEKVWDQREAYLRLALPHASEKGMLTYQIALCQWQQHKIDQACQTMLAALNYPDLDGKERQNALFYLAGFYADANNFQQARRILQEILRADPGFAPARLFLERLSE